MVIRAGVMPADVVAPVGVADVARRRGEIWLEGERVPVVVRVAREPDLVAVVPEPAPAAETGFLF